MDYTYFMKAILVNEICQLMKQHLSLEQNRILENTLNQVFTNHNLPEASPELTTVTLQNNTHLIGMFIAAKKIEGCSENTLKYYNNTLNKMASFISKDICSIETNDLRLYLANYQNTHNSSKITLDNIRRIMKETLSDEHLEQLRDQCSHPRDLAIIDLLISTGIRLGELVKLNRNDINFEERECVVLGKGDKERKVYFDAKTKVHLTQYLNMRTDSNPALFVGLNAPWNRLSIAGVEKFFTNLGHKSQVRHMHPHKFRRTMATMAIEKGMPIEQVQKLLGHTKIDTTLHYAIVNIKSTKALKHEIFVF